MFNKFLDKLYNLSDLTIGLTVMAVLALYGLALYFQNVV